MNNIFYCYILECSDKSFYTGYTPDLVSRIEKHNNKQGAKYTRARLPVKYVFFKAFSIKNKAMSFEMRIKSLTRKQKERLIAGGFLEFWTDEYHIKKASKSN